MFKAITHITLIICLTTNPMINPTANNTTLHEYNSESLTAHSTRTETTLLSDIASDSIYLNNNIKSVSDSGYISTESLYFDASSDFLDNTSSMKSVYTQSTDFEYFNTDTYPLLDTKNIIVTPNEIRFREKIKNPFSIKHSFPFTHNYTENILTAHKRIVDLKKNLIKFIDSAKIKIKKLKKFSKKQKVGRK